MSKDCTKPRIASNCDGETLVEPTNKGQCPSWEACMPFGGRLYSRDGCTHYEEGNPPEDGVYGKVVVKNGCIAGVEKEDIPLYTSSPCAPVPVPCDCEGGGSMAEPSTVAGNLFEYDAAGRPLVKPVIAAGDGVTITGSMTAASPLVINVKATESGRQYFRAGNNGIELTGAGTQDNPYNIALKKGMAANINGMSFDEYGTLIDYLAPADATTVNGILAGDGIEVQMDAKQGIATIGLMPPIINETGSYQLGGFALDLQNNRILSATRNIVFPAGRYILGEFYVDINEYGSIENIEPVPQDAGAVKVSASKLFRQSSGDFERSMSFTTGMDSAFRISYKAANIPADLNVYVDEIFYAGQLIGLNSFEVITSAVFAAGQHTVTVQTDNDAGLTGVGILDVILTRAV